MFRLGLGLGFWLGFEVIHQHVLCTYQGFIQDFLLGGEGGNFLKQQNLNEAHFPMGGLEVCPPPQKCFITNSSEIKFGGFWQLADCYQVPITCV